MKRPLILTALALSLLAAPSFAQQTINGNGVTVGGQRLPAALASKADAASTAYALSAKADAAAVNSALAAKADASSVATIAKKVVSASSAIPRAARIKQIAAAQVTSYSAKSTSYAAGIYTASVQGNPPTSLFPGQQVTVNFSSANPAAASLIFGSVPAQSIKVLGSNGTALALTGGEIVPGPATLTYDGSQYILGSTVSRVIALSSGTVAITQASWSARDTYLVTGAVTLTLPCSSTLSGNGGVNVAAMGVTATVNVTGGCSPDYITKNAALGTSTSATITQNASILTNGAGGYYVSGQ